MTNERETTYQTYIERWCNANCVSYRDTFRDDKIAFAMYDIDLGLSLDIYASYEEIFNDCFCDNIKETILDYSEVLQDEFDEEEINELKRLVGIDFVTDEEIESLTNGYQGLVYEFCQVLEPVILRHKKMFKLQDAQSEEEAAQGILNAMWGLEAMWGMSQIQMYQDAFYDHIEIVLKQLGLQMFHDIETNEYKVIRKGEKK